MSRLDSKTSTCFVILLFGVIALGYGIGLLLGNAAALAVLAAGTALLMYSLSSMHYIWKNRKSHWARSSLPFFAAMLIGIILLFSGAVRVFNTFLYPAIRPEAAGGALFTVLGLLMIGYSLLLVKNREQEG